ncbi:DUF3592 domain-containing protein [Tahibacter amnicola]|uniref:DUF3592 domain-containing protein n=1 Tax=Tahibacter amnicola TaxID=2976241 RepID=A0ABY6B9M9_9GAMM|nr:DUF3592 domain-containing protein [Tahibacter amnicola]UXI65833.1 DUF3592 domain-containing protein [Tahibacter amnicola]
MPTPIRHFVMPVLAAVVGVVTLGNTALHYDESRTVERSGVVVPVKSLENPKWFKRSGKRVSYRADVTFTTVDGRGVTAEAAISDSELARYRSGSSLEVRYLPNQPDVIRLVGEEDEGTSGLLLIVGIGGLAYGTFGIARRVIRKF